MSGSDVLTAPTKGGEGEEEHEYLKGVTEQDESGKEEYVKTNVETGLFYAYARRSDHTAFSRYILTFASAAVCNQWFELLSGEVDFKSIEPVRESAQLFSFKGDDVPGHVWRHKAFDGIKTKWFYTQIGDATGTTGRAQSILPIMAADGALVSGVPPREETAVATTAAENRISETPNKILRFEDDLAGSKSKFDFDRLEANLTRITQLLESTATKNAELEQRSATQAQTIDKLTSALRQSAEQIQMQSESQRRLIEVCEELQKAAKDREEQWERMSTLGSTASVMSVCGHDVRRPPRKVGRKIIGYVYGDKEIGPVE
jgi:uncharacterized coiled-coil protein SlyX